VALFKLHAQPVIRTVIPEKAVITGEPFRIQFVVENSNINQRFDAPDFFGLKIIRGPEVYSGTQYIKGKKAEITNYVYTIVADRTGEYRISPAAVKLNGLIYPGNEFIISVIQKDKSNWLKKEDNSSGYVLMPGEDPYKKIAENLFVKLFVDRRACFVGEPIVASFKLFSRLQSKSEIIKNPGFYGFSVNDMISLDDRVKETERVNGKDFEVHTIRKVQLYPLSAGEFTIDEMKIDNRVEFSRSMIIKKTEQEISEGVLNKGNDEAATPGAEVFETSLSTEAVTIKVNPLPAKNKPVDFNGAAGNFTIKATLEKIGLEKNEEGFLIIRIEGKGNFTQVTAPRIDWPKELEGFEPAVTDLFDNRNVPLSGSRVFRYPFISTAPGTWTIPAVRFSFYNTDSNKYRSISTGSNTVTISNMEFKKKETVTTAQGEKPISIEAVNKKASRIAFTLVALLVVGVVGYLLYKERNSKKEMPIVIPEIKLPSADEVFEPLSIDENITGNNFYPLLQRCTWKYLTQLYNLSGTEMNKNVLAKKMVQHGNDQQLIDDTLSLLTQFETAIFTKLETEENRQELLDKTKSVLKRIQC
jgi:BatD DUF11 like domain